VKDPWKPREILAQTDFDQPVRAGFPTGSCKPGLRLSRDLAPLSKGPCMMSDPNLPCGMAALSICEALLLALTDAEVLPRTEIRGILEDAATPHETATGSEARIAAHRAAARLIHAIDIGPLSPGGS
jgi:hypothetical protein